MNIDLVFIALLAGIGVAAAAAIGIREKLARRTAGAPKANSVLGGGQSVTPDAPKPAHYCYGESGEDMLLQCTVNRTSGVYLDIGAFKPVSASNTYWFYEKGWRGITIEPRPGAKVEFDQVRPGDINLNLGVSDAPGTLDYYYFGEDTTNTFDPAQAKMFEQAFGKPVQKVIPVEVQTMTQILDAHLGADKIIDFASLDVEGLEMKVLRGWDLEKYPPRFILCEDLYFFNSDRDITEIAHTEIYQYLRSKGYIAIAQIRQNILFRKQGA